VVVIAVAALMVLLLVDSVDGSETCAKLPTQDTSGYASVETTNTVSPAVRHDCLHQERIAIEAFKKYKRARACFLKNPKFQISRRPARTATTDAWLAVKIKWKAETKRFNAQVKYLKEKMQHPGGSSNGIRWKPLARWVGWPEYTLSQLCSIIMRESSGRERAYNGSIGCTGLLQIWPGNLKKGESASQLMHALFNLTVGLRIWYVQHCSFYPAWSTS
jgi:hypothetical protein